MTRLQFKMYLDEKCRTHRGISSEFIDGKGNAAYSWWSAPPDSISHVDIGYLKDRYWNVKTKRHEEFIKKRFKEEMQQFEEYQENRFKRQEG